MEVFCAQREEITKLKREDLKDGFSPNGPVHLLENGVYYINQIDSKWRRFYQKQNDENGN